MKRFFLNADLNKLFLVIAVILLTLWLFINELTPLLIGIVVAYVLKEPAKKLEQLGLSRALSAGFITILLVLFISVCLYALPKLLLQFRGLGGEAPQIFKSLAALTESINNILPEDLAIESKDVSGKLGVFSANIGDYILKNTLSFAQDIFSLFVFMVVLPLLVFFLLKDKDVLLVSLQKYAPQSPIFGELWGDMDEQFGSYVRGKLIEAGLLFSVSWIAFLFLGLKYSFALALMIGFSVFVPFVGAVAVTFPVVAVAYLQFGWSSEFAWVVAIYTVIQTLDGQALVPLLFSEVVKLHPVVIFAAIIFFGNLWGFWGVFFAIPLASLVKTLLHVINTRRA